MLQAQRFWDKYDVQKNMKVWLKNLSKANWKNLRNMAMNYANDAVKLDKTRWTTYDPKNGNYGFELYVPFDLKDMEKLPKVNVYSYIRQAQRVMDDLSFDEEWCIWDTIYKYMPRSLNVRDWIPPFKGECRVGVRVWESGSKGGLLGQCWRQRLYIESIYVVCKVCMVDNNTFM